MFDTLSFAWEMEDAGVLTFLEFTGDAIKRIRVTPSSATDMASMLDAAQAATAAPRPPRKAKKQG